MKDKILKLLDKYIPNVSVTFNNLTWHFEGKINKKIVIVKYSEVLNQLFCGIEKGKLGITKDAKHKGNKMLKQLEKELFTEKAKEKMN